MQKMAPTDPSRQPWYRQFWPWFLISLPGAIVIASFFMLYLALSHDDSRVRDNYYKEGLAINQTLAQDQRAANLGISASLTLPTTAGGVQVQLHGHFDNAPRQLLLQLIHPLDSARDVELELHAIGGGDYTTPAAVALPQRLAGRWYVELRPHAARGEASSDQADSDETSADWRLRNVLYLGQRNRFELAPVDTQP